MKKFFAMLLTCMMAFSMAAIAAEEAEPYYVAFAAPFTGDNAKQGEEGWMGLQMAVEPFNEAGGVDGHKIVIEKFDDKGDTTEAANIAQQLVSDKKFIAVIGSFASGTTIAGAPIYEGNMVQLAPTASSMQIPDAGAWTWMMGPDAKAQFTAWTKMAVTVLGAKKIGLVLIDGDNGKLIHETVTAAAPEFGAEVVAYDYFIQGQTRDFTSILQKINKENPDLIGLFCSYSDSSALIMQARDLGIDCTLFAPADSYNQYLLDALGDTDTTNVYVGSMITNDSQTPSVKAFTDEFHERYDIYPSIMGLGAYESGNFIIRALKDGATDRQSLYDTLMTYPSTGGLVFDETFEPGRRCVQRDIYFVNAIENGEFKCIN